MTKHYVTFGQAHAHAIGGKTFDKDCVARFDAPDAYTGRLIAQDLFGHPRQGKRYEPKHLAGTVTEVPDPRGHDGAPPHHPPVARSPVVWGLVRLHRTSMRLLGPVPEPGIDGAERGAVRLERRTP